MKKLYDLYFNTDGDDEAFDYAEHKLTTVDDLPWRYAIGLELSIAAWVFKLEIDPTIDTPCGLCECEPAGGCNNCPVSKAMSDGGCRGTPYYTWVDADHHSDGQVKAVKDEIKFLKSLRDDRYHYAARAELRVWAKEL